MKNHYQTLGLEEGASQEAIQEAYDRLFKELDPVNNDNQEFFIEELEKLEEAYKVLRNSSILATEKGINNSKVKPISSSNSIKNKNESNKESKKINLLQWLLNEKKKISLFILVAILLKILIHFFIFPTETLVLNTDKKVFVAKSYREIRIIKRGSVDNNFNGNKLIVFGDSVFYYPKELKKVSIAEHIYMTFTERVWLFPCIIILLLLLLWINNKTELSDNKKHNRSSYFSKQNIIISLLSLSISFNVYLFIKINEDNSLTDYKKTVSSEDIVNTKSNNYSADEASGSAEEENSFSEDASSSSEDEYSYMIRAEKYMNNAAQSAQYAEEFASSR